MNDIIGKIRLQLNENADAETKKSSLRFFKEKITLYGVKTPVVRKISKESFSKIKAFPKKEIFDLVEILWQSGYLEESFIASDWTHAIQDQYLPEDFDLFRDWIDSYVNNWASCDTFCNHPMGDLIQMYPDLLPKLIDFTHSDNQWMKRAAAVSLIIPAKRGLFLNEIFQITANLLSDKELMVQKGCGWVLKVASTAHLDEVFDYVVKNKKAMSRTTLRYAIEKMPQDLRKEAMKR